MKKLFTILAALFVAVSCSSDDGDNTNDEDVVIVTLEGTTFSLSEFERYTFPATDTWIIDNQSATTEEFAGLSAALEYISGADYSRKIVLELTNLTEIPEYAIFGEMVNNGSRNFGALVELSAPNATTIGAYAFEYCSKVTQYDLPEVEYIGVGAFKGCSSLASIDLPKAVDIAASAFSGCSSISGVELPLAEDIRTQAFLQCKSLETLELPSALAIESAAFAYCTALTTVDLPEVLSIGDYAFCDCLLLTSVSFPALESIEKCAFSTCESLESLTLPSTLSYIGAGLFNDSTALTTLDIEGSTFIIDNGIVYNADQSEAVAALCAVVSGDVALPSSVIQISDRLFYGCTQLSSIDLPSVDVVSNMAFAYCNTLVSATLSAAYELQSDAFYRCDMLETFDAPMLTIIGSKVFYDCDALTSMSFATAPGVALESIEEDAFEKANLLSAVLTVGSANDDYVTYGHTLTVGDFSITFDEIDVLDTYM
ncbi:MAG: leucine-rich repeat protein [Rikenellaceae bacterium]